MAQNAGLLEKLGQQGHYTLFAPTNEAFESLGSGVLERLQGDKEVLKGKRNFLFLRGLSLHLNSKKITKGHWNKLGLGTLGLCLYFIMEVKKKKC